MNTNFARRLGRTLVVLSLLPLLHGTLMAASISYQGQLQQTDSPFTGTVNLRFHLYSQAEDGAQIGPVQEYLDWPINSGLFQVELDFGSDAFDGSARWLEIWVDGQALQPRQRLTAVPVAVHALSGGDGSNWVLSGTNIHYLAGNVGIGVDSPAVPLQVAGTMIVGSTDNQASNANAFVSGGSSFFPNSASGGHNFVGGGLGNSATGARSFVGGGDSNLASGIRAFVGGGFGNEASGESSFLGAGANNLTSGFASFVAGGRSNEAEGLDGFVGGGSQNRALGDQSFVAGGEFNRAAGQASFAAGRRARAFHDGTFVWADTTDSDFASTAANQFLVRAEGGIGFGRAPQDRFEIYSSQQEQDQDFSFGTGALRVMLADGAGVVTRFRVLGNGGVAIGGSYTTSGVPNLGLRVAGRVRLDTLGTGGSTVLCRNGLGVIAECAESSAVHAMAIEIIALKEALTAQTNDYERRLGLLEGLLREAGFSLPD